MVENSRSSGSATLVAMVSGLAPGKVAKTVMTGKSTRGTAATGMRSIGDDARDDRGDGQQPGHHRAADAESRKGPCRVSPADPGGQFVALETRCGRLSAAAGGGLRSCTRPPSVHPLRAVDDHALAGRELAAHDDAVAHGAHQLDRAAPRRALLHDEDVAAGLAGLHRRPRGW